MTPFTHTHTHTHTHTQLHTHTSIDTHTHAQRPTHTYTSASQLSLSRSISLSVCLFLSLLRSQPLSSLAYSLHQSLRPPPKMACRHSITWSPSRLIPISKALAATRTSSSSSSSFSSNSAEFSCVDGDNLFNISMRNGRNIKFQHHHTFSLWKKHRSRKKIHRSRSQICWMRLQRRRLAIHTVEMFNTIETNSACV